MSADLDDGWVPIRANDLARLRTDYAKVVVMRDRLGEALGQITLLDDNDVAGWNEVSCALDEWRAAKERTC